MWSSQSYHRPVLSVASSLVLCRVVSLGWNILTPFVCLTVLHQYGTAPCRLDDTVLYLSWGVDSVSVAWTYPFEQKVCWGYLKFMTLFSSYLVPQPVAWFFSVGV